VGPASSPKAAVRSVRAMQSVLKLRFKSCMALHLKGLNISATGRIILLLSRHQF
jgi:hypothetical protein